jgi:hypothetical protein
VRLLLDAYLSSRRIGGRLGVAGHDVLALATKRQRVLVTRNSRDFAPGAGVDRGAARTLG